MIMIAIKYFSILDLNLRTRMNKLLLSILFLSFIQISNAQQPAVQSSVPDDQVFIKAEIEPEFPGGDSAWKNYLNSSIHLSSTNTHKPFPGDYTVKVKFIISDSGNVADVSAESKNGYGMEEEVIRVIKNSPRWKPARQNDRNVNFQFRRDIVITIPPRQGQPVVEESNQVFTKVEIEASYPGGLAKWKRYLETSLNLNSIKQNKPPAGTYTVIVKFIISKEGVVSDVSAETKYGYGMEAEAIRLIKASGTWTPANQNGRNINSYHRQAITIVIGQD